MADPWSIAGAVAGPLLDGIFGDDESKANDRAWKRQLIAWGHEDDVRADERGYTEGQNRQDRVRERQRLVEQRAYERSLVASDRAYERERLNEDRAYAIEDRNRVQAEMDRRAVQQRDSRGIDFQKLRDQAIAAGFNPLSVLGNAGMYSTELGLGTAGGPYQSGGGNAITSSTSPGASLAGSSAASGYSSGAMPPVLSSGSWLGEAVSRAADTYFNSPPEVDPLAEALRVATSAEEQRKALAAHQVPRSQGFALTKVQPFVPAASYSAPALSKSASGPDPYSSDAGFKDLNGREGPVAPLAKRFVPVFGPTGGDPILVNASSLKSLGKNPYDQLTIEDIESVVGDVGSEALSMTSIGDIVKTQFPEVDIVKSATDRLKEAAKDAARGGLPKLSEAQKRAKAESVVNSIKDGIPKEVFEEPDSYFPPMSGPEYDWYVRGGLGRNF